MVLYASKRSFIAKHFVINSICANSFILNRFKTCTDVLDLIKF